MKVQHIIGADISKTTIDLVCHLSGCHLSIENTPNGFKQMLKWIEHQNIALAQTMFVMEHTGLYSFCFEEFLHSHQIAFTKVSALAIKRSLGLVRGKSDKIDATRIASYGYEKKDKLSADPPTDKAFKSLQLLYVARERMVRQRAAFICVVKEYRNINIPEADILIRSQLQLIKSFGSQIEKVEDRIRLIVDQQEQLKKNFCLLQSIKGVGKVLALAAIIKTHNFSRFANARKFACFCGTAPFEHTSGSSVRGRTKVSPLADKQMKTLLDLSAKSAIQNDKELKAFYLRRTESGKSKMSTINIVRNKILYRMFAVIKRQTPFVDNYLQVA
jgi:transposase